MGAVTYPDPAVVQELQSWTRRSVDVDEESDIASAFGIKKIPIAVALDGEGNILARIEGFQSPEKFARILAGLRDPD